MIEWEQEAKDNEARVLLVKGYHNAQGERDCRRIAVSEPVAYKLAEGKTRVADHAPLNNQRVPILPSIFQDSAMARLVIGRTRKGNRRCIFPCLSRRLPRLIDCSRSLSRILRSGLILQPLQNNRIERAKPESGIWRGKPPIDRSRGCIMRVVPSGQLRGQQLEIGDSAIQTPSGEDAQVTFCDVKPTAVLRGMVDFKLRS